jgi:hypothetical protein
MSQVPLVSPTNSHTQKHHEAKNANSKFGNFVQTSTCGMFEEALNFIKQSGMVVEDLPNLRSLSRFADRWGFVISDTATPSRI